MSKINVQFHAEPDEIIQFIKDCAEEYNLHIVLIELHPSFAANLVNETDGFLEKNVVINNTNRVCLYINKPDTFSKSYMEFIDRNPDCLSITIGNYDDNKLEESIISSQAENAEALKIWKKIIKRFNSITLSGAWVVNPNNGVKAFYKHHRYTKCAKKLNEDGVRIVPVAGWNFYILSQELKD